MILFKAIVVEKGRRTIDTLRSAGRVTRRENSLAGNWRVMPRLYAMVTMVVVVAMVRL